MAEMDNTTSGIIWQWLGEHKQDILDYFSSIMREASDIQLVNFDIERHMGLLATYIYQGVRRVDNVKPITLVDGLIKLNEDLRIRCENAAEEAEFQGSYAKTQGDRVEECITGFETLYARVKSQGDTAEEQGANAQAICDTVSGWYTPFKEGAESWLSTTQAEWDDWNSQTQNAWDEWYAARLRQWQDWFSDGIVPDWNAFWSSVQQDWSSWTAAEQARQQAELDRIDHEIARMAAERVRISSEEERQRQEGIRQKQEDDRVNAELARADEFSLLKQQSELATSRANEEAGNAKSIYDTVRGWFNGDTGFMASAESWLLEKMEVWDMWFSDTLATGIRKVWTTFYEKAMGEWASLKRNAEDATAAADAAADDAFRQGNTAEQQGNTAKEQGITAKEQGEIAEARGNAAQTQGETAERQGNFAEAQGDYARNIAEHPSYIANGTQEKPGDLNYWYIWDYDTQQYVKDAYAKGDDLHYDEMLDEEKEDLARKATEALVFATVETCEAVIDELI